MRHAFLTIVSTQIIWKYENNFMFLHYNNKNYRIMKKNLFIFASLLLVILSAGCSKGEDESEDQLTVNF